MKLVKAYKDGVEYLFDEWKPFYNAVAYFPLEADYLDKSKNKVSMTASGTITYTTLSSGKKVANFQGATVYSDNTFLSKLGNGYTISYRYTVNKNSASRRNQFYLGGNYRTLECGATTLETNVGGQTKLYYYGDQSIGTTSHTGWTHAVVVVTNHNQANMYINGQLYTSHSTTPSSGILGIGYSASTGDYHNGYMSEFIVENKARTAQEITDYYNNTKSNYGL